MFNSDQKRAFIAVLLSGVVLFGWQYFFASKLTENVPVKTTKENVVATATSTVVNKQDQPAASTATLDANTPTPVAALPATIVASTLKNKDFEFKINNDLSIVDMKNPNSVFSFNSLSDSALPLRIQVVTDYGPMDLFFEMEQQGPNKITGKNLNYGVTFAATILDNGRVNFNLSSEKEYKLRFVFDAKEKKLDNGQIRHFSILSNDVKYIEVANDKDEDGVLKWFGTDFNYHLFALVLKDKMPAKYKTTESGQMIVDLTNASKSFSADLVFTKKNYDGLIALGDNLHLAVDFGFFAVLAVPTLRGLQFIYKFIPNYGIAIILLTILIRLITFPLQYKSFKSMKKMQLIQPELAKVKEKFKDEPQKMQKETMDLFKTAGANPLSGCLPLILQMPFFFAIYKVLYSSVELVGAPFYFWIHDLSIHDPFYVLPVLMGLAMLAQQKLTPQTSVDPTQQKIMLFMPVIFAFIMKSLPAGLVLYIFVSTIVGVAQQALVYKMAD
ncbi:MAG: membrane protein insertase YidC [Alphaproteobacteria bacterium]|nr:MAG: membrane protein insertase YidC [Alphaproteobacteria bacterium]